MQWENSTQALDVVLAESKIKRSITEESMAALIDHVKGIPFHMTLESVSDESGEFIKKIDEALSNLQNISVDVDGLEAFLKSAMSNPNPAYVDDKVMFIPSDDVGRINTGYYTQTLRKWIETTLVKVTSGEIDDIAPFINQSDVIDGIKRQTVNGSYKGSIGRECFSEIPAGLAVDHSPQFINHMILPFVRSYTSRKKDVEREAQDVKKMISSAYSTIMAASKSLELISDPEKRRRVGMYLTWIAMVTSEVSAFVSYLIIRKIDVMILNATNVNDMCDNIRSYGMRYMSVESTRERLYDSITIDNLDDFNGILSGYYNRLKYAAMNSVSRGFDTVVSDTMVDVVAERNSVEMYPSEHIITAMECIVSRIRILRKEIGSRFPRPLESLGKLNLEAAFADTFSEELHKASDIDSYMASDGRGDDLLFFALAEIKRAPEVFDVIKTYVSSAQEQIDGIKRICTLDMLGEGSTDDTIKEIQEVSTVLEDNLTAFVQTVVSTLDERYFNITECVISRTAPVNIRVTESAESSYFTMAMESVIGGEEFFGNYVVGSRKRAYRNEMLRSFHSVYTEAGVSGSTSTETKESNKPVVKEDPSKMSSADKDKNAAAVSKSSVKSDPSDVKKLVTDITNSCKNFFTKMIEHFRTAMSDSVCKKKMEDFSRAKDAVLARSWGGVELNIRKYPEFPLKQLIADIQSMKSAVSGLNFQQANNAPSPETTQPAPAIEAGEAGDRRGTSDIARQLLSKIMTVPDNADVDKLIKSRYQGINDDGTPIRETYRGAALRKLVTDTMIPFCEEFYGNGRNDIVNALNDLQQAVVNKLAAAGSNSGIKPEDIRACNHSVQMMSGAVLTAYRNRGKEYLDALLALVPKNKQINNQQTTIEPDSGSKQES